MKNNKNNRIAMAVALSLSVSANGADFTNGGFDSGANAGTSTGWTTYGGTWTGSPVAPIDPSVYMPGGVNYSPNATPQISIVGTGTDANAGGTSKVFDGSYAIQVNNAVNDRSVSVLTQTVNNYDGTSINFAWKAVLQGSHLETDSDHFVIRVYDNTSSREVALIQYSSATAPAGVFTNNGGIYYSGWRGESIRTTQGHSYTLSLLVADCPYGGHWGYVYLDSFGVTPLTGIPINVFYSGPSSEDTLLSMSSNAYSLRGAFNLQSATINNGLTYDCTTFDKNGICLSAGGRVTDATNPATNSQGALVIAAYRPNPQFRVGAYLDQNLSSNDARGVNLSNSNPMGGVFAVWNQNTDGTGYQVRVAAGYSDKDVSVSRSVIGTAEAGLGSSSLRSQAVSASLSRGFRLNDSRWIASPYVGVRYTRIKRAGYTEDLTADVQNPLTYSGLSQETTTALAGVRFNGQFGDKVNVLASAGVESDISHNTGNYSATGVDGLTPIAFNQNIRHVRPVAQAGVRYAIDKRQTVGANMLYRQEAFNSTHSVTGMVNYEIGF